MDNISILLILQVDNIQILEGILFTLNKINANPNILPGIRLGTLILDSCDSSTYALEQSLDFIKGSYFILFKTFIKYYAVYCCSIMYYLKWWNFMWTAVLDSYGLTDFVIFHDDWSCYNFFKVLLPIKTSIIRLNLHVLTEKQQNFVMESLTTWLVS